MAFVKKGIMVIFNFRQRAIQDTTYATFDFQYMFLNWYVRALLLLTVISFQPRTPMGINGNCHNGSRHASMDLSGAYLCLYWWYRHIFFSQMIKAMLFYITRSSFISVRRSYFVFRQFLFCG